MSAASWYQQKAAQCSRIAKEATDEGVRARYEDEARLWRKIAADEAAKNTPPRAV
jgi:hypothetical protein